MCRLRRPQAAPSQSRPRRLRHLLVASVLVSSLASLSTMTAPATSASTASPSKVTTLTEPSVAKGGFMQSSSCVKGPVCVSLGWNHHGNDGYIWAARWQNHEWRRISGPIDSSGGDDLTISCTSSIWCMATGANNLAPVDSPIADELIGTRWTSLPVPTVKGSTNFSLFKLDCRSPTWCVAVGIYVANRPDFMDATYLVSEVWNGSKWRIVPIKSPRTNVHPTDPGSTAGGLHPTAAPQQISCVSKRFCFVVGFFTGVFVDEWNGQRWSRSAAPNRPIGKGYDPGFTGGTCVSTTFCVATGGYHVSNAAWRPLVEMWNGEEWRIATLPPLPQKYNGKPGFRLSNVFCSSSKLCVAYGDTALTTAGLSNLIWNGRTWRYVAAERRNGFTIICQTKTECILVD